MKKKCLISILLLLSFSNLIYAQFKDGDINQDGVINNFDLSQLIYYWLGDCYSTPCYNTDTNNDSIIDFLDFVTLAENWKITNNNSYQVAYWPFNETTGTTAYDATTHSHNGTIKNMTGTYHVSGKRGNALSFDGNNDYVEISAVSNGMGQYFTKDFSIAVWVYQAAPIPPYQTIIGIEGTNTYTTYGFEGFTIEVDDGLPVMYIADSNEHRYTLSANTAFTTYQWQHLCIVRQGPNVSIYINGILDKSYVINDTNIHFGSKWPGFDTIGEAYDSSYGHTARFKGRLDDIHLYNYAIPETLVNKLAQQDYAWKPEPANTATNIATDTALTWQKGIFSANQNGHDVYFGTNSTAVTNATTSTTGIYKGRQTSRMYEPTGLLAENTNYYWRIDDVNGSIHKGSTWTFRTTGSGTPTASSSQLNYDPAGAFNGNRFDSSLNNCWKGIAGQSGWYWQMNYTQPHQIGSLLMIMGEPQPDNPQLELYQINAPLDYIWQYSNDGTTWTNIDETLVEFEPRIFRIQRFASPITAKYFRLNITDCFGLYPTIREIEFYDSTTANISFPNWLVAVDITNEIDGPYGNTEWFFDRARQCTGWTDVQGQQIWVPIFCESYLNVEPYPLCVFVSGSFDEWCQVSRDYFSGMSEVLTNGNVPMWASCGGAQLFGLLSEPGWINPWDCPRCRERLNHNPPYSPIYGYIGYIDPSIEPLACASYENNIYEQGDYRITKVGTDPAFTGLTDPFYAFEWHCGQLNYLPTGWHQIGGAPAGEQYRTQMQCFRKDNKYIYGAQFHIENDSSSSGTNNNSRTIMVNFLNLAVQSGGYHPPQ